MAFAANDTIVVADESMSQESNHSNQNAMQYLRCQPTFHSMNWNVRLNATSAVENWNRSIDGTDDGGDGAIVAIVLVDFVRTQYPKINLNSRRNLESTVVGGDAIVAAVAAAAAVDDAGARVTMTKGQMKKLN